MTAPEATRLAAIIAGIVALSSVVINVVSAQLIRWQERRAKENDWLRDKQVRDVEEIIPTIDEFLSDFAQRLEILEVHVSEISDDLSVLIRSRENGFVGFFAKPLVSALEQYNETMDALWKMDTKRRAWFGFKAKRLSIWFEDAGDVESMLDALGSRLRNLHLDLHRTSAPLMTLIKNNADVADEADIVLDDEDIDRARVLQDAFNEVLARWPNLRDDFLSLQKLLAGRYKPTKMTNTQRLRKLLGRGR